MSAPVDAVTPPPVRVASSVSPLSPGVAATVVSVLIAGYWAGRVAVCDNHHEDLWIYSSGSWLATNGQTPYDVAKIHERVAERWPDDPNLDGNSGFFLSPQALLVMAPFAVLPWAAAKAVWCAGMIILGVAVGWRLGSLSTTPLPGWFTAAAVAAVLLNPLSLFVLIVGQTTLLVLGCVVLGQVAFRAGRRRLGCLLWAVAFVKPHLALPLLPLAWYLSGWRRAAEVAAWAAGLNALAGLVFFGDPLFTLEYLRYVQHGHQTVEFNRVAVNKQITAWNRLVVAGGGPAVELGMAGTVTGYAVFFAAAAVRVWWGGGKPTANWAVAVAGSASLACCQLLPYELPLLCLTLPHLGELLASGRRADKLAAGFILAAAAFAMLPGGDGSDWYRFVRGLSLNETATGVLQSHRCLGVLAVAAGVVGWGPARLADRGCEPAVRREGHGAASV